MQLCKKCGNELREGMLYCDKCGAGIISKTENGTNIMAVIGFVVSIISIFINLWGVVGIGAVVVSTIGLIQINRTNEKGKGMAIAGISVGAFSVIYAFALLFALIY